MLPSVNYESLHFYIPAAIVNKIAAWVLISDDAYMQSEINKHGVTTAIKYQGKVGFHRLNEVPKPAGTATPYYGTTGGVYNFIFNVQEDDTLLRIRHSLGNQFKLKPYETVLGSHIQFERHSEASNRWFSNRLETIIEEREKDFRFFIDGEIYANLLATGWSKETVQAYQYKFIPTTVGCHIIIRNIASAEIFDLTEKIDW